MKIIICSVVFCGLLITTSCATTAFSPSSNDQRIMSEVISRICERKSGSGPYVVLSSPATVDAVFVPTQLDESARSSLINRNAAGVPLRLISNCDGLQVIGESDL